jgi:hypothetical protein
MIKNDFLLFILIGVMSVVFITALTILILKIINIYSTKKYEQYSIKYDEYINHIQNQLDKTDELLKPCFKLDKFGSKVLEDRLIKLIATTENNNNREKLVFLCERLGFVKNDLLRLRSKFSSVRLKAVNRIRVMGVTRALPRLVYLLDLHKKEADKNAISLAIVKCSETNEYIIKMLYKMSKTNNTMVHLVEPIKESEKINRKNLILEIITEDNDELTKFGLLLVNPKLDREVAPYLYKLSQNEDKKDIKFKSIRLLADMNSSVLKRHIDEYINSEEWELRSVAASLVGNLKLEKYIPKLKSNVNDSNSLVIYNSLKSLAKINVEGFKEVCRTASDIKNNTLQKMIFCVLEEEAEKNSIHKKMQSVLSTTMVNSLFVKN